MKEHAVEKKTNHISVSSVGGLLILTIYFLALYVPFSRSISCCHPANDYKSSASSSEEEMVSSSYSVASTLILTSVFLCSVLNSITHIGVVAGVLDDSIALSILIGVGFDFVSQLLYFVMYVDRASINGNSSIHLDEYDGASDDCQISSSCHLPVDLLRGSHSHSAKLFLFLCISSVTVQLLLHLRALRLHLSFERMSSVVKSAQNNLLQDPGKAYLDHLFAFSDLGGHMFHLVASVQFLGMKNILFILFGCALAGSAMYTIIQTQRSKFYKWSNKFIQKMKDAEKKDCGELLRVDKYGKPVCRCMVCRNTKSAFFVDVRKGSLCMLWFYSFGQLCDLVKRIEGGDSLSSMPSSSTPKYKEG